MNKHQRRAPMRSYLESGHLANLLLESTGEGIYGIDISGACTFSNSACLRLLGYKDTAELIGKHMHGKVHHSRADGTPYPEDECRICKAFLYGEGSHVDNEVLWRSDGTSFPIEYWAQPVRHNNVLIGSVVTFVDITERKRAGRTLQKSERMFRELAENIRETLCIITPDPKRIDYINPAYDEVFGRPREELYRRPDAWLDSVHPDDRHFAAGAFEQSMQGVETAMEFRIIRPDGSVRWIRARNFPVRDSRGKLDLIVGLAEDYTDRQKALDEMKVAKEASEAANRAKNGLLARMSHEIRTPMNGIMGMTDLLLGTELTAEQTEYLQMVKTSADSLLTIINNIFEFSQLEAGTLELEAVTFDLRKVLEEVMNLFKAPAHDEGIELHLKVHPSVPATVAGDPNRLRQILVNLVGNALKFTERGEIAVEVCIDVQDGDRRMFHFSARDTGIGIPDDKQLLIFEAFSQADSSLTRKFGGAGLGLTISHRLVGLMGGRIWIESEVGKGSTFHFTARLDPGS